MTTIKATATVVTLVLASGALATGPREQNLAGRAVGDPLYSVVEVNTVNGRGTGTVIGKHVDPATNDAWFTVLTADHVVRGGDGTISIKFGDAAANKHVGAGGSWYLSPSRNVRSADIALAAVKYGQLDTPERTNFFNAVHTTSRGELNARGPGETETPPLDFTQVGYGWTGSFVNGGMRTVAGVDNPDGDPRFQNNTLERWVTISDANYLYDAVRYFFNVPAGAGFLAAEGIGFAGDSGGPFFSYAGAVGWQNVGMFRQNITRNPDGTGGNIPAWGGGAMQLATDLQIAVFTSGNSVEGGFNPFDTTRGNGVPLTAAMNAWINDALTVIPSPGSAALGVLSVLCLARRRRVG